MIGTRSFSALRLLRSRLVRTSRSMTTAATIQRKLQDIFAPEHLDVLNESHMHNVPKGSETHFRVLVVSDKFAGMPLIQRHRAINETLSAELADGVHALAIQAKTPQEWEKSSKTLGTSPPCLGGRAKEMR